MLAPTDPIPRFPEAIGAASHRQLRGFFAASLSTQEYSKYSSGPEASEPRMSCETKATPTLAPSASLVAALLRFIACFIHYRVFVLCI